MKTLNRPMFRYGGPIKEGVMSGIREPKKNGGLSKQFNTGLVGDERYPKTSGREHHFAFLAPAAMAAARFLPAAYRGFKAARAYKPISQNLGIAGRLKDIFKPSAGLGAPMAPLGASQGFRVGSFIRSNPLSVMLPGGAFALETGTKAAKGIAEMTPGALKSYANAIIPFADPFTIDKEKVNIDIDKDPNLGKTTKELGKSKDTGKDSDGAPIVQLTAKEKRAQQIQKYRDIMDIKGMNKGAAYDSLIAASQAVNEAGGDLKGSIRDGSLINQIIQSTSKAFDKPAKTKDAIVTLILKAEIEKDINKDKNRLDTEYKQSMIDINKKKLEGSNFAENKAVIKKAGGSGQSGIDDAAALNNDDFRGNLVVKTDLDKVIKGQKEKGILDQKEIVVSYTNTLIEGKELPDGDYTVGDYLVTIQEGKVYDVAR